MKETGLTGKRRSTTIAATPDDGNSQRKRSAELTLWGLQSVFCITCGFMIQIRSSIRFLVLTLHLMTSCKLHNLS